MIDVLRHLEHVDRQLDIHVAFDAAPPHRVGEFLCRLGHHRIAIVIEPIDERSDRRIFLVFDQSSIVKCSDQPPLGAEQIQQSSVIDIECQTPRGGVEVGSINEKGESFFRIENHLTKCSIAFDNVM